MLCLVCYLFIISTSAIDCLERFVSEMTYYVSSGTLNLTKPKPKPSICRLIISNVEFLLQSAAFSVYVRTKQH